MPAPLDLPVSRREWLAVAALVLLAAGLRFAYPGRMAIEHFDEGVYASNIFFTAEEGGQYPYRHLYAPPLLPILIEWGIIFLGPDSIAPFLPALVLGTATVPLAWWAARCWFGPASGLAAGLLVATSDFHLLYSRTALTDVPVAFFLLLAVYHYWESVRRASVGWAIAAGVATGLAWWTKYTGWLPLAIAASGSAAWVITECRAAGASPWVRLATVTKLFVAMAVTAFVVWSPVLWGLQEYGGYAAVAENHRGYLSGARHWTSTAVEQVGNVAAQSGVLTAAGMAIVVAFAGARSRLGWEVSVAVALACGAVTVLVALHVGPVVPLGALAVVGLATEYVASMRARSDAEIGRDVPADRNSQMRRLSVWLVAAWLIGMTVTIPLYQEYPRLMLAWLLPAWLALAAWLGTPSGPQRWPLPRAELLFAAVLIAFGVTETIALRLSISARWFTAGLSVPGWQDRTGVRDAATRVADFWRRDTHGGGSPTVLYAFGQPAAYFHLASRVTSGQMAVLPAGDLAFVDGPPNGVSVYTVMRPYSLIYPDDQEWFSSRASFVSSTEYLPSSLVRLDEESRYLLAALPHPDFFELNVYHVRNK